MKVNRMFYIEDKWIDLLEKQGNMSKFINGLIERHFDGHEGSTKEELQDEIALQKKEKLRAENKLAKLEPKLTKLLEREIRLPESVAEVSFR